MKYTCENNTLVIFLSGHVDSSNAEATEKEIREICEANKADSFVIDADELSYISSAGLRVILRLRKDNPELKVINVNSEVYEIFDMTGFTEMMTIEKAYRRISVDGCEVIGQGANGKVYRLDPDTIIKVYFNPDSLPDIQRERDLARKAFVKGIPTAIPYDVVRVEGSYGSVFEMLNALTLAQILAADPSQLDNCVERSVDLLKKIHATEMKKGDMPDMKAVALNWAGFLKDYLPADQFEKLYRMVEAVPENNHLMHGDYHVKNVMVQNGENILIDMDTLCMGDPIFEFASIFLAYIGYSSLDRKNIESFLGITYEQGTAFWKKTLQLYFGTEDEATLRSIEDKARVIGYTRMMRRTIRRNGMNTPEGRAIIDFCRNELAELLARVDSLSL